jgi:hypothetical protein
MKLFIDEKKLAVHRAKEQRREVCLDLQRRLSEEVGRVLYTEDGDRTDVPLELISLELTGDEEKLLWEFEALIFNNPRRVKVYHGDSMLLVAYTLGRT